MDGDLLVIGGGPGGYAAAFRAADLGKRVTLIDKDQNLGGVCLNRGCIPSKTLLHISKTMSEAKKLSKMGVFFQEPKIELKKIRQYKEKIIKRLSGGLSGLANKRKVTVVKGTARFLSNETIEIKTENKKSELVFKNCIIATGSTASMVSSLTTDMPGVFTSRRALDIIDIPKKLLIVGGGIIGLELGQVYAALGSEITLVEFRSKLLSGIDPDLVSPLYKKLSNQFESILLSTSVASAREINDNQILVQLKSGKKNIEETFNGILVSAGRKPNTENLDLKKTDIKTDRFGYIMVDKQQKTTVKNIFAVGDLTGAPLLAHKATHEGKVAAEVICGAPSLFDKKAIPSVVYTNPEIAWAGLTEEEAKEKNVQYEKGEFPWLANGKALSIGAEKGKTKILFDSKTKRILGIGIVGDGAGDLISEGVLAIEMGADAEDIGLTVHPHPTLSETVGSASEIVTKAVTEIFL